MGASGGAVANLGGALNVEDSRFSGNQASRAGGAIGANAGTTSIDDTVLDANSTGPMPGNGGALHLTGVGEVRVSRSTVTGNTAAAEGGGLWNSGTGTGTMTVDRTELTGNMANGTDADQGGGALFNDGGSLSVQRSTVAHNAASRGSGSGGGILNDGGQLTVGRTTISGNDAARAGGGIETDAGSVDLDRVDLTATPPARTRATAVACTPAAPAP